MGFREGFFLNLKGFAQFCASLSLENGKAMKLEPFQRKMLGDYFDGCQESLILIPKKNGKSTLLAAVALYRLISTDNASIAIVASSRDQAMILFEQARGFVQRSDELQEQVRVLRGYREIRRRDPKDLDNPKKMWGLLKVYAADADTADGWLGDLVLVDELHRHKSLELYSVLRDGLGPRQGQMLTISTAGDTDDSPLGLLRARAYELDVEKEGVYRHVRAKNFCLHEWGLEGSDDPEDFKLVAEANPAPWHTAEVMKGKYESPSMTPWHWARFNCGIWGHGGERAFDSPTWDSLAKPGRPEAGRLITLGFDGARRKDGTALVGCDIETGHLFVLGYWQAPAGDENWSAPEDEVDQIVDYAFETWRVWRLYADPPYWESAINHWSERHGKASVQEWWTNRIKTTAIALRGFRNDMRPEEMSHDGDERLAEHIRNAVRKDTNMEENDEPLWLIQKDSRMSPRKIDLAMAAMLAWEARGDAIAENAAGQSTSFYVY